MVRVPTRNDGRMRHRDTMVCPRDMTVRARHRDMMMVRVPTRHDGACTKTACEIHTYGVVPTSNCASNVATKRGSVVVKVCQRGMMVLAPRRHAYCGVISWPTSNYECIKCGDHKGVGRVRARARARALTSSVSPMAASTAWSHHWSSCPRSSPLTVRTNFPPCRGKQQPRNKPNAMQRFGNHRTERFFESEALSCRAQSERSNWLIAGVVGRLAGCRGSQE